MRKPNNFKDFVEYAQGSEFDYLHDDEKALALVHHKNTASKWITLVDAYKIRTWENDGSPKLIQYLFTMQTHPEGNYVLSFTESPIIGSTMSDLENFYSLLPYIYAMNTPAVPPDTDIH